MRRGPAAVVAALLLACAGSSFDSQSRAGLRLLERGRYEEAAAHYEAALEIARSDPAPVEPLITTLIGLSDAYVTFPPLGKEDRAAPLLAEARRLADEHLSPDHGLRLEVLERQGTYFVMAGRWEEAREPLEQYLMAIERIQGPEVAYRTPAARNLTEVYSRLGDAETLAAIEQNIADPESAISASALPAFDSDQLYLEPNALDLDGTPAFVHYTREDMPLRVAIPEPRTSRADADAEAARLAAVAGFESWATALRRVLPWFRLEVVEEAPSAAIQVEWSRRPRGYLPARGWMEYGVENGRLRLRSRVVLSIQPVPSPGYRIAPGELRVWAMHAFGSALGLPDCTDCDSMMSMAWLTRDSYGVTPLDVRTYEALTKQPNGGRVDGGLLAALESKTWLPAVSFDAPRPEPGVLADLPFINDGRGGSPVIDVAPEDKPSIVVTVDTGAAQTVLTTDYARALGISVRSIKSDQYQRDTVTGDPLRFWVTGQAVVGGAIGDRHFNYALLGGEFMEHYVVELDFERRRVRFLDPKVHRVGDEQSRRQGEIVVDLKVSERRPYARLEMGTGSVFALVDTGAEGPVMMTEERARALGIAIDSDAARARHVNVLGNQIATIQRLPRARMGGHEIRDVDLMIGIADESSVRVERWLKDETIVGIDILRPYRVRLDYPRQKMGLLPTRAAPAEDAAPGE